VHTRSRVGEEPGRRRRTVTVAPRFAHGVAGDLSETLFPSISRGADTCKSFSRVLARLGVRDLVRVTPFRRHDPFLTVRGLSPAVPGVPLRLHGQQSDHRQLWDARVQFAVALIDVDHDTLGVEPTGVLAEIDGVGCFGE
jgi:hypothetical protein